MYGYQPHNFKMCLIERVFHFLISLTDVGSRTHVYELFILFSESVEYE